MSLLYFSISSNGISISFFSRVMHFAHIRSAFTLNEQSHRTGASYADQQNKKRFKKKHWSRKMFM
jgi:hypothetical protein